MGPIAGTRWLAPFACRSEARSVIEASVFEANVPGQKRHLPTRRRSKVQLHRNAVAVATPNDARPNLPPPRAFDSLCDKIATSRGMVKMVGTAPVSKREPNLGFDVYGRYGFVGGVKVGI